MIFLFVMIFRRAAIVVSVSALSCVMCVVACGGSPSAKPTTPETPSSDAGAASTKRPDEGSPGPAAGKTAADHHREFMGGCAKKVVNSPDYCECAWGEFRKMFTDEEMNAGDMPAAKLEKVKKVAVFGQNDDYGKLGMDGVKKGLTKLPDVKLVAEVFYEVTDRELGTHALKIKESGADAIIIYSTATHAAGLIKEMAKVGFRPKIFSSFTLYDRDTMFRLLGDLWEGAYFNTTQALRGEPAADRYIEIVTKIDPKLKGREGFCVQGAADVAILVEGLKRAGKNLTRESFMKAMETIKDYDDNGLTAGVTFGPDRHHGYNAVRMMRAGKAADSSVKQVTGYQIFPPKY